MIKKAALAVAGIALLASPFIVSAQTLSDSCANNLTVECLEQEIQLLLPILNELLALHNNHNSSATIDASSLVENTGTFALTGGSSPQQATGGVLVFLVPSNYGSYGSFDYSSVWNQLGKDGFYEQISSSIKDSGQWNAEFNSVNTGSYIAIVYDGTTHQVLTHGDLTVSNGGNTGNPSGSITSPLTVGTGSFTISGTAHNTSIVVATIFTPDLSGAFFASGGVAVQNGTWSVQAPGLQPGTYLVLLTDGQPLPQGSTIQTGSTLASATLTVSGATTPTGTLIASNPNPVPSSIVAGGTTGVTVGAFTLQPSGENMYLQQIGLDMEAQNASPGDVIQAYVYQGSTLIGQTTFSGPSTGTCPPAFTGIPVGGCYFATTTIASSAQLVSGTQSNFTIKADIAPIGLGQSGKSGDYVVIGLADAAVSGGNAGPTIHSGSAPAQLGARIFRSYPIVAQVPLKSVIAGVGTPAPVLRFSITANPSGPVGIYKFGFNIVGSQATLTLPTYGVYSDPAYSQPVPGFSSSSNGVTYVSSSLSTTGVFAGGPVSVFLGSSGHALEIPAGQTYYFEVRDSVTPTGNATVQTTLDGDSSYQAFINANGTNVLQSNFFWSPNDLATSQFSDVDWTNGFDIPGLPVAGFAQTVTASSPVSCPSYTIPATCASGYHHQGFVTYDANNCPIPAAICVPDSTPPNPINAACPNNYLNNGACTLSHLIGVHSVSGLTATFFSFVRPGLTYALNFGDGTEVQAPTCLLPLAGIATSCTDAAYPTHTYAAAGTYNVMIVDYTCPAGSTSCNRIIDSTSVTVTTPPPPSNPDTCTRTPYASTIGVGRSPIGGFASPTLSSPSTIVIEGGSSACIAWCRSLDAENSENSHCVFTDGNGNTQTLAAGTLNPNLANALTALEALLQQILAQVSH